MAKLYVPKEWNDLKPEQRNEIVNGCGARDSWLPVPDTMYGLNVSICCDLHDFMYYIAEPKIEAKEKADRVFLNNLLRFIDEKTKFFMLRWLRKRRARKYYLAVKYFGGPAFWANKHGPESSGLLWDSEEW